MSMCLKAPLPPKPLQLDLKMDASRYISKTVNADLQSTVLAQEE